MGNLLGAPVTEKETHEGATAENIKFAVSSMQGWRVHMEDAHITEHRIYASEPLSTGYSKIELPGHAVFAVFDGHGGTFAAAYSGRNFCRVLSREPKFVEYAKFERERPQKEQTFNTEAERNNYIRSGLELLESALCDAFVDIDREIACLLRGQRVVDADQPYNPADSTSTDGQTSAAGSQACDNTTNTSNATNTQPTDSAMDGLDEEGDSGTTACVVVLTPNYVVCANAGDSRAVISRLGNKAVPLSYDHKPDDEEEERRIRAAGGYVAGGRVEGDLAVSRGLGDFRFKNLDVVMAATDTSFPDVSKEDSAPHDEPPESSTQRPRMSPGEQKVSPIPDIIVQSRNEQQDEFIIVACDGIWDVQTNYEAVQTVAELFREGETSIGLVCEEVSYELSHITHHTCHTPSSHKFVQPHSYVTSALAWEAKTI